MRWLPLAVVLLLLAVAAIGARYLPENYKNNDNPNSESSPINNAIGAIRDTDKTNKIE